MLRSVLNSMSVIFSEIIDQKVSELYYIGRKLKDLESAYKYTGTWADKFDFLKKKEDKDYFQVQIFNLYKD